jgi:hypothetical protein
LLVAFGRPNISKIPADNYIVFFGHVLLLREIGFVQLIHTCGTMSVSGNINHRPQPPSGPQGAGYLKFSIPQLCKILKKKKVLYDVS